MQTCLQQYSLQCYNVKLLQQHYNNNTFKLAANARHRQFCSNLCMNSSEVLRQS